MTSVADPSASVVRVLGSDLQTHGAGFIVTREGLIATCAHVVQDAGKGPGDSIWVTFQATSKKVEAQVEAQGWSDRDEEDVAFLRLTEPLPGAVRPVQLTGSQGRADVAIKTFGYPERERILDQQASGELMGPASNGEMIEGEPHSRVALLQLSSSEITSGYSGGPVWDALTGYVVGLVTLFAKPDSSSKGRDVCWATPTETLKALRPGELKLVGAPSATDPRLVAPTPPAPPPRFTDRRDVLGKLAAALRARSPEPLALCGEEGSGKTATALKVADVLRSDFPGGVFWAPLYDYSGDAASVLRTWARLCDYEPVHERHLASLVALVRGRLAQYRATYGPLLVIIDDVHEEWLEAAQWICQVVPRETALLLTTPVQDLALDKFDADEFPLGPLSEEDALELLYAYAPQGWLDAGAGRAKVLLSLVGYLPLSVKVLGKSLRASGIGPERIEEVEKAIVGRKAVAPAQPEDVKLVANIDTLYAGLPADEQRLFRWLGAFAPGPVAAPAVARVLAMSDAQAKAILDRLVSNGLLSRGDVAGAYFLHPVLHAYSRALLDGAADGPEARQRHMAFYLTIAETNTGKARAALDQLEAARPNLLLAMDHAEGSGETRAIVRFGLALSEFLEMLGYYVEGKRRIEAALESAEQVDDPRAEAKLQRVLGMIHYDQADFPAAKRHLRRSLRLSRQTQDATGVRHSLYDIGLVLADEGKQKLALLVLNTALKYARAQIAYDGQDGPFLVGTLQQMAKCYLFLGSFDAAEGVLNDCLQIYEQQGVTDYLAYTYYFLGALYSQRGDLPQALTCYQQALPISEQNRDRRHVAEINANLAEVAMGLGDCETAREQLARARSEAETLGHHTLMKYILDYLEPLWDERC